MSEVINLADRKPKDCNRRSIEIGKLVDLRYSLMRTWERLSDFNDLKIAGGPEAGSAAIETCTKMIKGASLMMAGLNELTEIEGLDEPSGPLDDRAKCAAMLEECQNTRHEFGVAIGKFLRFLDGIKAFEGDTVLEDAGEGLCEALETIGKSMDTLSDAERRLSKSSNPFA
ncbi:hypothetical protein GUK30_32705 [Rhizobium leguminosarum]|uniref:hypothetical protein n=1 Tax=Rhizobium ruizarguesonis TaxID=2081791 RepID=UPI0013C054F9|nr:hypothetical protein [Rhizobium ruizarguesonis]NEI24109.1 hypothetical protein [Rhizobium ruizarguesonis]